MNQDKEVPAVTAAVNQDGMVWFTSTHVDVTFVNNNFDMNKVHCGHKQVHINVDVKIIDVKPPHNIKLQRCCPIRAPF